MIINMKNGTKYVNIISIEPRDKNHINITQKDRNGHHFGKIKYNDIYSITEEK